MIRCATQQDIPALKAIWHACFPTDRDEDIDLFFTHRFDSAGGLVYEDNGVVCSMLYRLPCTFQEQKAMYLYALGTLPAYRSNGYMGKLIAYAHDAMQEQGFVYSLLLEGDASLCDYYKRFGYQRSFCYQQARLSGQSDLSVLYADVPYVEEIRREKLQNAVHWDMDALSYANRYSQTVDEHWFKVDDGYAIASKRDGMAIISELVCTDMIRAVQSVNTYFGVSEAVVKLPPTASIGERVYRGMLYAPSGETIENAYIAFTLE